MYNKPNVELVSLRDTPIVKVTETGIVAGTDPMSLFPERPDGDDITEFVNTNRRYLPQNDQAVSSDPPSHTAQRALLMGLITPKRLKENEEFIWRLTDRQLDVILARGTAEIMADYAEPYTLLVIADLLGVPEEDHETLLGRRSGNQALLGQPKSAAGAGRGQRHGAPRGATRSRSSTTTSPPGSPNAGSSRSTTC
jgi:cytochrome P450